MECEVALKYGAGPIRVTALNQSYLTVLIQPAIYTVMFYDYFLTLGLEMRFVWSSKWSLAKALYFATTYFNFTNLVVSVPGFLTSCTRIPRNLTAIELCLSVITICAAESVLSFRTWILWERNKNIAIGLIGLFVFLATPSVIFIVFWIVQQDVRQQPLLYFITFLGFVPLAFYESGVFNTYSEPWLKNFATCSHARANRI
ncbi:hypothetical protein K439DRAFT_860705 [Ramaria rubella]|nr:hypothetical protein K439DRAFT_860705 [Ramaria rubella]